MNARFLLLPVALFALSVAGCDSGPNPEVSGLQASPNAPTANLEHAINGPNVLTINCPQTYYASSSSGGYFSIYSGPATVSSTSYIGDAHYATVTRTAASTDIYLRFNYSGGGYAQLVIGESFDCIGI